MSLKPFTYPFPETRFLHVGPYVYKFKIRYGNSISGNFRSWQVNGEDILVQPCTNSQTTPPRWSLLPSSTGGEEVEKKEVIIQELEDSIRAVLGNLDNLQPFTTEHFIVFPYKSKWERVSHLKFKHRETVLVPYPFVFTLYVEMKWFRENLSPGKLVNNSPHGLVLAERKAARAMMRKQKCAEVPSSPSSPSSPTRPGLDRAKMGTSSQGLSNKKLPVETRRNRGRKTQQETPAFDITEVRDQDFKSGDSLAEKMIPPLQQNNPPPPEGPTELGTSGFFGFLSSLFPFRYFFRKSSQ